MKISCQSCQAKYTIADEKVLGKIVKIRCKKCGATIVINGNETDAASAGGGTPVATASDPGYAADQDQWTVNVADGDQRTMTVPEIVDEYKAGTIHDDTFCWKDGMNDWLPLREIESLYSACAGGGAQDLPPMSLRHSEGDRPEPAAAAPAAGLGAFGGGLGGAGFHAETNGNGGAGLFDSNHRLGSGGIGQSEGLGASGASASASSPLTSPLASSSGPSAARRTGGRGNQADLFGSVAQAGGEEDVMTSAAPVAGDGSKLTGQRNENSVLFSLGALTSKGPDDKPKSSPPVGDGSGLIDIRALASSTSGSSETSPKSSRHVDDIMNLGGGGAFSAALAAPVLAPPSHDLSDMSPISVGGSQNKTLYIAIIVGCLLIGASVIVAVLLLRPSVKDDPKLAEPIPTQSAVAPPPPPSASAPPAVDPAASASAPKEIAPGAGTKPAGGGKWAGGGSKGTASGGSGSGEEGTSEPAAPKAPTKAPSLQEAMGAAVGVHKEESSGGGGAASTAPFDRGAAAASLGNVNISSCKKGDGPTGAGHVKVTFQGSGTVSTVEVDTPPFSGTPVGGCIAAKYRSAHVPPFAGPPVTVGKGFSLN